MAEMLRHVTADPVRVKMYLLELDDDELVQLHLGAVALLSSTGGEAVSPDEVKAAEMLREICDVEMALREQVHTFCEDHLVKLPTMTDAEILDAMGEALARSEVLRADRFHDIFHSTGRANDALAELCRTELAKRGLSVVPGNTQENPS